MKIVFHNSLGKIEERKVTRVVAYDDNENPIALVLEYAPGMIFASTVDHPDFNVMLRNLGIDRVVVCKDVHGPELQGVRFE